MISNSLVLDEFRNEANGKLIMAGTLYRNKFSSIMSEAAYLQAVSRLYRSGQIERIAKGIYYYPKKTRFGTIPLSEQEIVDYFTCSNKGIFVGYRLYNSLGVTTQISKRQIIYSSVPEEKQRQIGNIYIHKYDLEYTPAVKSVIQLMELLQHYKDIQDVNASAVILNTERLSKTYDEKAFEEVQKVISYPKWTIAFLQEVLNYHRTPNHLYRYLSAFSKYPYPSMEDLYETARKHN